MGARTMVNEISQSRCFFEMTSSRFKNRVQSTDAVGADRCVCPRSGKLVQASESQVYLSFYSECSQGSSPQSGVKDESGKLIEIFRFAQNDSIAACAM